MSDPVVLLDVNVLIGLAFPNHEFHSVAMDRLRRPGVRWATCDITQLGFLRIASTPRLVGFEWSPVEAHAYLVSLVESTSHVYLSSPEPLTAGFFGSNVTRLTGHRQITDLYLLAVARAHGAAVLTFDQAMTTLASSAGAVEILTPG